MIGSSTKSTKRLLGILSLALRTSGGMRSGSSPISLRSSPGFWTSTPR